MISADKMTNRACGPVWHKKHKQQGIIPKGLRSIDRQATWCKSNADGWVYGHGSFAISSHKHPVLGCFMWMPNSANEAKRLWRETFHVKEHIDYVAMDSQADDFDLFRALKRQRRMNLITCCQQNMYKSPHRKKMIRFTKKPKHQKICPERSYRVEPTLGIVKDIFDLDRCWMRVSKITAGYLKPWV